MPLDARSISWHSAQNPLRPTCLGCITIADYQSRFFADMFPEENRRFANVQYIDDVSGDREASLLRMRQAMLSRADLVAAVVDPAVGGERSTSCLIAPIRR